MKTRSAHQDPQWFMGWFMENRPEDDDAISIAKNPIVKRTLDDYKNLVKKLQEKLDE